MKHSFPSGRLTIEAHLAEPPAGRIGSHPPAVVLCHGFPGGAGGAAAAALSYPELADRVADELGWLVLAPALRGAGASEGQFSLIGWLDDISAAVAHLRSAHSPSGIWLVGFGTGGALCICAAARDPAIKGVAALGAPADFDDWASQPRRLLDHARAIGLIDDRAFPAVFDRWSRELREVRAVQCMGGVAPRPVLVLHGTDDESVPPFDARVLADAHGCAELRMVGGAGHALRHDPRAVAVLLGWLDRQRTGQFV
ncbi:MAG: alpha/beta fold hydrolase [Acidimicrobiia bacterium]|nr:alpha/beta fold hydrolase [Acidimicrobiia bacterium]